MHDNRAAPAALLDGKRERTPYMEFFDSLDFPENIGSLIHFDVGAVAVAPSRPLLCPPATPTEEFPQVVACGQLTNLPFGSAIQGHGSPPLLRLSSRYRSGIGAASYGNALRRLSAASLSTSTSPSSSAFAVRMAPGGIPPCFSVT